MKECVFFNEIIFFIQYNLQLEHTYSNDPPIILYHLCNDFLQNTVPHHSFLINMINTEDI